MVGYGGCDVRNHMQIVNIDPRKYAKPPLVSGISQYAARITIIW